jgi:hypothetical protein
MQRAIEK